MDLTPQVINEVEFSMARRGYDPDQVDEFLEKVAVAVGELTERIAELRERVTVAERRAEEAEQRAASQPERVVAPGPAPSPAAAAAVSAAAEAELETLKRTLLLAQRTADAAVREAEEEAQRILSEAETAAQAAHEATLRRVLEEITQLETTRDALRRDTDSLGRHVEAQRSRLAATIGDLQRVLAERLLVTPAPVESAPPVEPAPASVAVEPEPEPEPAPEPVVDEEEPALPPAARQPAPRFVVAEDVDVDEEAWARFGDADELVDEGPRTEPVLRLDRLERGAGSDDDAYLTELRKAMLDDTGAPDAADGGYFDEADAGRVARTRFGRRR